MKLHIFHPKGVVYLGITWLLMPSSAPKELTYLPLDKMATVSQRTFLNAILSMKIVAFGSKFHQNLFQRVQSAITSVGSDNGLAPTRRQAII